MGSSPRERGFSLVDLLRADTAAAVPAPAGVLRWRVRTQRSLETVREKADEAARKDRALAGKLTGLEGGGLVA